MTLSESRWPLWLFGALWLALLLWTASLFISQTKVVFGQEQGVGLDTRLSNVVPEQEHWLIGEEGGYWSRHGWHLPAGSEGRLHIRVPGERSGTVRLRLWAFSPGQLGVSVEGRSGTQHISAQELDGRVFRIPVERQAKLVLVAVNQSPGDQLVLDRFAAVWFPEENRLPSVWPILAVTGFGLAGGIWLMRTRQGVAQFADVTAGIGGIWGASAIGFLLRWDLFDTARGLSPEPDAAMYLRYARSFEWFSSDHGFYSASFNEREPAHVALLNWWFHLWGSSSASMMWYTLCLSTLLVIAVGLFLWKLSGRWWIAVSASVVMAVNPAWIDESIRGLRLESLTLFLLGTVSIWLWGRDWVGGIMFGALIGCMTLIQSPAMGVFLPLIWLGWSLNTFLAWKERPLIFPSQWRWGHLLLASVVALALFIPHLVGMYRVHGDMSWPSYGYARWNANVEFPDRLGTDGFPSVEEFENNPYAGPRLTYLEYLFGLHTVPQLLYGQIKGWAESTVYMSTSHTPWLKGLLFLQQASGLSAMQRQVSMITVIVFVSSLVCAIVGWIDLWCRREWWWVPLLTLWGTWHAAYLYSVRAIEPFRHTAHIQPLLLFSLLWGGIRIVQWLRNHCSHRGADSPTVSCQPFVPWQM